MQEWVTVERTMLGAQELVLARRGEEWVVRVGGRMLMSNRVYQSEIDLAVHAIKRVKAGAGSVKRVLIGGLGLGYTLRATLDLVAPDARVIVAELAPALVDWNRVHLAHLHDRALDDKRTEVVLTDIYDAIASARGTYDVMVLDVDNGPEPFSQAENERLYNDKGVRACWDALTPGGVLGVWSAGPYDKYTARLAKHGFVADVVRATARKSGGFRHVLFFGQKPAHKTGPKPAQKPGRKPPPKR